MKATFTALDDDGEDVDLGTITFKDGKASTESKHRPVREAVEMVNSSSDPEAAMRELPTHYRGAYLRCKLEYSHEDRIDAMAEILGGLYGDKALTFFPDAKTKPTSSTPDGGAVK